MIIILNCIDRIKKMYIYTVDAAYNTRGYKVQSLIRLKIAWNGPDVSKYIKKKSVIRLTTLAIRLKFRRKIVEKC